MFEKLKIVDGKNNGLQEIIVIDSDFESLPHHVDNKNMLICEYCSIIISVYKEKQLNVACNLFLYLKFLEKRFGWKISEQIYFFLSHKNQCDFHLYLPEIQKYLLFI